jgi:hypothetical protein
VSVVGDLLISFDDVDAFCINRAILRSATIKLHRWEIYIPKHLETLHRLSLKISGIRKARRYQGGRSFSSQAEPNIIEYTCL